MLQFYSRNQKMIHKLLINQIAISALGLMVGIPVNALAYNFNLGNIPNLLSGIFTAAMYWFVIYDAFWEWGTKYISGKGENVPTEKTAVLSAGFAFIPTTIILLAHTITYIIGSTISSALNWILILLCNGMHFGTLNFVLEFVPEAYSEYVKIGIYALSILITMGICALGFHVGKKGKTMFAGYFHKKTDRRDR